MPGCRSSGVPFLVRHKPEPFGDFSRKSVAKVMLDLEVRVMADVEASPLLTKGPASPSSLGQSDVALKRENLALL